MKARGLLAVIPLVTLLGGCTTSPESAITAQCLDAATQRQAVNFTAAEVESEASGSERREGDGEAFDISGTTTVTEDYTTTVYNWECFGQRVDGKNYAAIQSMTPA